MAFDFGEYIEENLDFRQQVSKPEEYQIDCINPDCDDNWRHRKKMAVNVDKGVAYCFKCGTTYRKIDFVAEVEGISRFAALKIVKSGAPRRTYGVNRLEAALDSVSAAPEVDVPCGTVKMPYSINITPDSEPGRYLKERQFGMEIINHFGLRYQPAGPYGRRILIPIYYEGQLVTFQARAIDNVDPKYLFPREGASQFQSVLYNWDEAKKFKTLILVEGVTDLWRLWSLGFRNGAATFGKSLKSEQRQLILNNSNIETVIFFWDGEALDKIYQASRDLTGFVNVLAAELPDGMEPDNCPNPQKYFDTAIDPRNFSPLQKKLRGRRLLA